MKNPDLDVYKLNINDHQEFFQLYSDDTVPKPGITSRVLAESVVNDVPKLSPRTALDLGCGVGLISLALKRAGVPRVYAADIMREAVQYAAINSGVNHEPILIRQSDGFTAYPDVLFDFIIDDVSRVRDDIARLSSWFPSETPGGGDTGSEVTSALLRRSPRYLSKDGSFYFSISSLSDTERIVAAAMDTYTGLEQKASQLIPLHREFGSHIKDLLDLEDEGKISLVKKGEKLFWQFDVWRAYDPKD